MTVLYFLELFGTAIFAISGAYTGARKGMDIAGVLLLALVVGNGGGTMRDLFLNNGPVFWMTDHNYLWVSIVSAIVAVGLARFFTPPNRLLLIADALGLGVFAIVGAQKSLMSNPSLLIATMMGVLTGTGGSIIRDLICNEVPLLLQREIYATAALAGILVYFGITPFMNETVAMTIGILVVVGIRLAAIYFDWSLPAFSEAWFHKADAADKKERKRFWWFS